MKFIDDRAEQIDLADADGVEPDAGTITFSDWYAAEQLFGESSAVFAVAEGGPHDPGRRADERDEVREVEEPGQFEIRFCLRLSRACNSF